MAGCPSSHQLTRIREEMLESGGPLQWKLKLLLYRVLLSFGLRIIISSRYVGREVVRANLPPREIGLTRSLPH